MKLLAISAQKVWSGSSRVKCLYNKYSLSFLTLFIMATSHFSCVLLVVKQSSQHRDTNLIAARDFGVFCYDSMAPNPESFIPIVSMKSLVKSGKASCALLRRIFAMWCTICVWYDVHNGVGVFFVESNFLIGSVIIVKQGM